jgi:hypothetical protein
VRLGEESCEGRLLLLVLAAACLVVPSGAGGSTAISYTIDRHVDGTAGANGWYVGNVHVYWIIQPQPDQTIGCDARTLVTDGVTHFDCVALWGQPPNQTRLEDAFDVRIDRTPPSLSNVSVKHGNRNVLLSWTASPDTQVVQVTRAHGTRPAKVVYRGTRTAFRDKGLRPGAKYQYTVTAFDQAANAAAKMLGVTGTGPLVGPAPGDRVTAPVKLEWLPVKGASYYNVQLIHNGRIFSAWPRSTSLKLPLSWTYHGRRYRMRAGVYRWYVWPGFGKLARAHYGRLLGGSAFVYAAK